MISLKSPLVSIIIPTFNRENLVENAIRSVLNQTYKNWELIIVDDCSTDNTEARIDEYLSPNIRYIKHPFNKGGSAARNTGIIRSNGSLIAFLDSDDEFMPSKIERQVELLVNSDEGVGAVYTGFETIDDIDHKQLSLFIPSLSGNIFENLLRKNYIGTTSTVMIKRVCFEDIGLFDETLPSCQDWDLWVRLSKKYQVLCISDIMVRYLSHNKSISKSSESVILGRHLLHDKIEQYWKANKKLHGNFHLGNSLEYFISGDRNNWRKELLIAIKYNPFSLRLYFHLIIGYLFPNNYLHLERQALKFERCLRGG